MGYERNDRNGYGNRGRDGGGGDRDAYGYGRDNRFGDRDRGYDRSSGYGADRGYGSDRGSFYGADRDRGYGRDQGRDYGNRDYGRAPQGYDYQDRGFFDRAGDEVRSWFGDEDAERRRRMDERYSQQEQGRDDNRYRDGGRFAPYGSGYSGPTYGGSMGGDRGGGYSTGDYGAGQGAGATSQWGLGAGRDQNEWGRDPGYHSWRDRQIQALDSDYDEYRREYQTRFDSEFGSWRTNRQGQRDMASKVQEHAEVVGSDGKHVGTVDHVRGDNLLLTKTDPDAGGKHHLVPSSWIQSVEGNKVTLSKTADQAKAQWRDAENQQSGGGLFSNRDTTNRDGTNRDTTSQAGGDTSASAGSRSFTRS